MSKALPFLAGLAGVYLCFLTASHYWDGVLFSLYIEKVAEGALPAASLFHPNHLLYSGLGYLAYELLHFLGLPLRSLTALQIVNVAASVACSAILFRLCTRLFRSSELAVSCTLLFALGATWWKFSTDADSYIIAVLFSVAAVAWVLTKQPRLIPAGICLTLAMLFHQLAIFGYIPILVAIWLEGVTPQHRLRRAAGLVFPTAACVAIAYLLAYSSTHGGPSTQSFFGWMTSVSRDTKTTHSLAQFLLSNASSYSKLFGGGKLGLIRDFRSAPVVLALLFAVVCVVAAALAAFRRNPSSGVGTSRIDRRVYVVLWSWTAVYVLFLSWFEPGNAFYKLFVWPPIVLLIGSYFNGRGRSFTQVFKWLILGLASWNFAAFIYPHSHIQADPLLMLAKRIDKELPKSATVYYKALSPDDWYLEYFAPGRNWQPLPPGNDIPAGTAAAPACFETTALPYVQGDTRPSLQWHLVNSQHNVRLECKQPTLPQ